MRIPDEIIERIKSTALIEDVVGEYVRLKKMGRSLKGLCPFHSEKTPSFNVNTEKGFYHCFGCGEGGNVFTFIMKMNNMNFVESVKFLAAKYGIAIPEESQAVTQEDLERQEIFKVNEKAAYIYHFFLTNKQEGLKAREYLKKRNISEETINKFNLGFSPAPTSQNEGWNRLYLDLKQMKYSDMIMEKAQLIRKNQKGNYYDSFRNRLMVPIQDIAGHVLGFGGRVIPIVMHTSDLESEKLGSKAINNKKEGHEDKNIPKYINSAESPVFKKSETLFALNHSKNIIRDLDEVIIVEGYFDVMMLFQKGVKNVVAPLGTSLTEGHINLLRRYTRNAVLIFDPDVAGEKATWRTVEMMLDHEYNIRILRLPFGMDPFDYLNTHEYEAFMELKNSCPDVFTYMIRYLKEKFDIKTMLGKLKLLSYIFKYLIKLKNALEHDIVINTLAKELDVTVEGIKVELERYRKDIESFVRVPLPVTNLSKTENDDISWNRLEREFILLLLMHSEKMEEILSIFKEQDFSDDISKKAFRTAFEIYEQKGHFNVDDFINYSQDPVVNSKITAIMLSDKFKSTNHMMSHEETENKMFYDYRNKILKKKLDKTIDVIKKHIVDASRIGDVEAIGRLQSDYDQTIKMRNTLLYKKH